MTNQNPLDIVIMAAGRGTRMKSAIPKVLQKLAGTPLIGHVLKTALALEPRKVIAVLGKEQQEAAQYVNTYPSKSATSKEVTIQDPPQGTGDAVRTALTQMDDDGICLVLSGDVPLIEVATLNAVVNEAKKHQTLTLLSLQLSNPCGYGRMMRDAQGNLLSIVEEKDANAKEKTITEVYSGILACPTVIIRKLLQKLQQNNAQNEYYLTEVASLAIKNAVAIQTVTTQQEKEVLGINSPEQLAQSERLFQHQQARELMKIGVRLADPTRFDVRGSLNCGADVEIDVNCIFEGRVTLSDNVKIGANCVIKNAHIAKGAVIHPFCHIEGDEKGISIGQGSLVGPFARLRVGTQLGDQVHIGNFVEVKNSSLGQGSKANHLAYLGDAIVAEQVNYGAGAITANYDGANKHRTTIEANVHIGSNAVLVAPVTIGQNGTVAAGSVITKNTTEQSLSVARGRQVDIPNWHRPKKT